MVAVTEIAIHNHTVPYESIRQFGKIQLCYLAVFLFILILQHFFKAFDWFFKDTPHIVSSLPTQVQSIKKNERNGTWMQLLYCSCGLFGAYLIWALLQERIVTKSYKRGHFFRNSQLLVFCNRLAAVILARTLMSTSLKSHAPIAQGRFALCSYSNCISSWLQ